MKFGRKLGFKSHKTGTGLVRVQMQRYTFLSSSGELVDNLGLRGRRWQDQVDLGSIPAQVTLGKSFYSSEPQFPPCQEDCLKSMLMSVG